MFETKVKIVGDLNDTESREIETSEPECPHHESRYVLDDKTVFFTKDSSNGDS